jgi:hypothetical protein
VHLAPGRVLFGTYFDPFGPPQDQRCVLFDSGALTVLALSPAIVVQVALPAAQSRCSSVLTAASRGSVNSPIPFCSASTLPFASSRNTAGPPIRGEIIQGAAAHCIQALNGKTDLEFLKRVFGKLTANFGWWVNRKDRFGRNLFEGGFLGLDNIGVFDRSAPLPTGGYLEQADGTAWVALFCQNMLEIAFELAAYDSVYEELVTNYAIELLLIARAMNGIGPGGNVG